MGTFSLHNTVGSDRLPTFIVHHLPMGQVAVSTAVLRLM